MSSTNEQTYSVRLPDGSYAEMTAAQLADRDEDWSVDLTFVPFTESGQATESEQDRAFMEQMEESAKHIARVFQISSQMLGVRVVEGSIENRTDVLSHHQDKCGCIED